MTDPVARYTTEEGYERFFVTGVIDLQLFQQLEDYRAAKQISRSDAIRRILSEHLSRQLNNHHVSNL